VKAALQLVGIDVGSPRRPLGAPSRDQVEQLRAAIADLA
jgi:dihydrodipicolinate synthase/N-acetylneuraminate lyase